MTYTYIAVGAWQTAAAAAVMVRFRAEPSQSSLVLPYD